MSTSFTQTTVYFPPNESPFVSTGSIVANVSNLGASQSIIILAESALIANQVISIPFQVAVPPPILYFSTDNATDSITLQSPDGLLISLDANVPGIGFNGAHFQPSAGGRYVLYFKSGPGVAVGAALIYIQAVLENTIGQYINFGGMAFNVKQVDAKKPVISQSIALNTTSSVPNTMNIDFDRAKVEIGMNVLATFRIMVNASGVESYGKDYMSVVGSATRTVQLVAGQNYSAIWYSTTNGLFSGRYSLTISQAGSLTLPATCSAFAAADIFPSLVSNSPEVYTVSEMDQSSSNDGTITQSSNSNTSFKMDEVLGMIKALSTAMANMEVKNTKCLTDCFKRNDEAHSFQNSRLAEMMEMIRPTEMNMRHLE